MKSRHAGLTLLEVMIAVMMLGSGLVAIASLFPVAGTLQRRTYDDVVVRQVGDSVEDLVATRGFSILDITADNPLSFLDLEVHPVPAKVMNANDPSPVPPLVRWGLGDRCYPTAMGGDPLYVNRSYYWVPLVRKVSTVEWQLYMFILKKEPGASYGSHATAANPTDPDSVPKVEKVPAVCVGGQLFVVDGAKYFEVGDLVLDSQGVTHVVTGVTPIVPVVHGDLVAVDGSVGPLVTALWYSPRPSGGESPTRKILTLGNGVVVK